MIGIPLWNALNGFSDTGESWEISALRIPCMSRFREFEQRFALTMIQIRCVEIRSMRCLPCSDHNQTISLLRQSIFCKIHIFPNHVVVPRRKLLDEVTKTCVVFPTSGSQAH